MCPLREIAHMYHDVEVLIVDVNGVKVAYYPAKIHTRQQPAKLVDIE